MAHKKGHPMEEFNTGVLADPRTPEEKKKDWQYSEIASGDDVVFSPILTFEEFSVQNQVQSSSCVFQAIAKAHEVIRFRNGKGKVNHSAGGYAIRSNKPGLGTFVQEGLQIAKDLGVPFEADIPSEGMSEAQMNAIPYLSKMKTITNSRKTFTNGYITSLPKDFVTVCKEIVKGNPVLILIRCNILEWNQGCPQIYGGVKDVNHEITGVQAGYWTGELRGNKGEKIILNNELIMVIHDSWGNLGYQSKGIRIITKKFFDTYVDISSMFIGFTYLDDAVTKPLPPTKTMRYGQSGENIKTWQKSMKFLGYFPLEIDLDVPANNRFGPLTRSHVKKLQMAHVPFFVERGTSLRALQELDGMSAGPQTLELVTKLINEK